MYQKPKVERFGTFRELTQTGPLCNTDGGTVVGANGFGSADDCPPRTS